MTSSFNLSRRPCKTRTNWSAYARFGGVCIPGWDTILIGNHDYKVCQLHKDPDGSSYIDGSANKKANETHDKPGLTSFSPVLYNQDASPEWMYNQIPYNMRRQLHEPRAYFDRYDYYRLPTNYDGTGYSPVRWPPNRGGKIPQYANDNVQIPPVWNPNLFQQPYPVQLSTIAGLENNSTTLTSRYGSNVAGCFYGECAPYTQFNRDVYL